jgi:hypothetical protein
MIRGYIRKDIVNFIEFKMCKIETKYWCVRIGRLWREFVLHYPLRYQKDDRFIVSPIQLLYEIKALKICSPFKFNRMTPKRYKFTRRRLASAKRLCV